ncbi:hypothetical protein ASF80_09750 [Microbacterium sp. Leaf159]|nr:hypothetical protein ASF80_09750 [Microbacterium sp. Leaf159]
MSARPTRGSESGLVRYLASSLKSAAICWGSFDLQASTYASVHFSPALVMSSVLDPGSDIVNGGSTRFLIDDAQPLPITDA